MTPDELQTPELPPRLAIDADGYVWRVYNDGRWSMARINPDNSPIPQPVTYYEPAPPLPWCNASFCREQENGEHRITSGRCIIVPASRAEDGAASETLPISPPQAPHNPPKPANYHPYA